MGITQPPVGDGDIDGKEGKFVFFEGHAALHLPDRVAAWEFRQSDDGTLQILWAEVMKPGRTADVRLKPVPGWKEQE